LSVGAGLGWRQSDGSDLRFRLSLDADFNDEARVFGLGLEVLVGFGG